VAVEVFAKALRQKADIYHIHDPEMMPFLWAIKWLTGKPVVADIHEYFPEVILARQWLPMSLRRLASTLIAMMEKVNSRLVDAVVVVTNSMIPLFPESRKCIAVRNFPSITFGDMTSSEPEPGRDYDLVHLGSLSPPRLAFMVELTEELLRRGYNYTWLLLGVSPETQEWLEHNSSTEVRSYFHCLDHVPHEEVPRYLRRCKVGINYHPYEARFMVSIPLKIFEYLCCGLPFVSSALPHVAEFLKEADGGLLVEENSVATFADGIITLRENLDWAREKAAAGYRAILREFSWEKEAEKLIGLYRNLTNGDQEQGPAA
jgi:glycosyltransferase involved in cell wall biosynthesis